MNLNRLRPIGVKKENLDLWLSSVINDAIRDAHEAGLSHRQIYHLLKAFIDSERSAVPMLPNED